MLRDNTKPNRAARTAAAQLVTVIFALFAMLVALVGGLRWFDKANADTEPPTPSRAAAVGSRPMHRSYSTTARPRR